MASDTSAHNPLSGDPARQAIATLRAYAYQIWRTVDQWITLADDETLFIECAEDIDLAGPDGAIAIQVKDTATRLSLASQDARDAIIHFWALKQRTSGSVRFQFLTRAAIATEQGALLERRPGIQVWSEAANGDLASCALLRAYLIEAFDANPSFCSYLKCHPPEELMVELFRHFEWVMEEPDTQIIQEFIRRKLIAHGDERGYSPSISLRALDSLFQHCWEVAQRTEPRARSLTRVDFLRNFDEATSVSVPMSALVSAFLPTAVTTAPVTLTGPTILWTDGIPPLPDPVLPRESGVAAALATLSQLAPLVLTGSAGKGKTTLAKLVALATHQDCTWMDLSGRVASIADSALSSLAITISNRSLPCLVVIDDFPIDSGSGQGLWTSLGMLQHACRHSGSRVLITTKGVPKSRLDARLLSTGTQVQQVDDLTSAEVTEFLERLGCPATMLSAWAKIAFSYTLGHPKLVHVFALELRDRGWPTPRYDDLLKTPDSITGQRANERLNVTQRESGPPLDFLYHLTLIALPFDRPFALQLGSRIEGLYDPGTTLDRFLGLWIEPSYAAHFRVTSLLTNEATEAWPPHKLKEAHGRIFESFLAGRTINIAHAFEVLAHGLFAQLPNRLVPFLRALLDTREPHLPSMARELKPIVHLGSGVGTRAIPFDPCASLLLRLLQFRIASREMPEELPRLADEWLWEVEELARDDSPKNQEFYRANKALWASSLALSYEASLPPQKILDAIIVLDDYRESGTLPSTPAAVISETGSDDIVANLFSLFEVRCNDIEYFDHLLDALMNTPAPVRTRMLAAAQFPHVAGFGFLVDTAWVSEFRKEHPDWGHVIRVLEKALAAAGRLASPQLGLHAAKALSIVFDEHLGNRDAATEALDRGRRLFGDHPLLVAQLANLHFHHDEFAAALALWTQSLARAYDHQSGGIRDPFAFRHAAMAAGRIGDYSQAAELFLSGSHFSRLTGIKHTATALLYDAAYCFFKAKRLVEMCTAMRDGLPELRERPDPEGDPQGFALQKFAGHIVLWILGEITREPRNSLAEPAIGCSSNPSFDRSIGQLPPSRWELTATNLIELEHRLRMPATTREAFGSILSESQIPSVELRLAFVDIEQAYRQGSFSDLPALLEILGVSLARVRAQHRLQQDIQKAFQSGTEAQDHVDILPGYYLLCALTAHILSGGNSDSLIESWVEASKQFPTIGSSGTLEALLGAIAEATDDAGSTLRDMQSDNFSQLAAAHVILVSSPTTPELSALAQVGYIFWLSTSHAQGALREVIPVLSASFAKTWKYHLLQPAFLLSPKLTVPAISSALSIQPDGPYRLQRILTAASDATQVRVPFKVVEWLRKVDLSRQ